MDNDEVKTLDELRVGLEDFAAAKRAAQPDSEGEGKK